MTISFGTTGSDSITGTNNENIMYGLGGNDTLAGGTADDALVGGTGADSLDGGAGNDTASYAGSGAGVNVDLGAGTASGGDAAGDTLTNIENLIGSDHDDTLTGDSGDNVLEGGGGNDTLTGGAGNDMFVFAPGDGDNSVSGGVAGDWTDTIQINGVTGGPGDGDWTINVTSGTIVDTQADHLVLTEDAVGEIVLTGGETINFEGIERVAW